MGKLKAGIKRLLPDAWLTRLDNGRFFVRSLKACWTHRGTALRCPCCGGRFSSFADYTSSVAPEHYEATGQNTVCPRCGALPRHRILCAYLSAHPKLLSASRPPLIFSHEYSTERFLRRHGCRVRTADLYDRTVGLTLDIQRIDLPSGSQSLVLCNHILQFVPDYQSALSELFRVLRSDGLLIISVNQLPALAETREDFTQADAADFMERNYQTLGLRTFGRDFPQSLARAGFFVETLCGDAFPAEIRPVTGPADFDRNVLYLCRKRQDEVKSR